MPWCKNLRGFRKRMKPLRCACVRKLFPQARPAGQSMLECWFPRICSQPAWSAGVGIRTHPPLRASSIVPIVFAALGLGRAGENVLHVPPALWLPYCAEVAVRKVRRRVLMTDSQSMFLYDMPWTTALVTPGRA